MRKTVLVISNPADEHTHRVLAALRRLGANAVLFYPEDLGQSAYYHWCLDPQRGITRHGLTTASRKLDLDSIYSVWYRRPRLVSLSSFDLHPDELEFARDEWRAALEGAYALAEDRLWVSHPDKLRTAARKPIQLVLARQIGLRIPRTCMTNDEALAQEFIESCQGRVIVKATGAGWVYADNGTDVTYVLTNRLSPSDRDALHDVTLAPVTFQEEIPKAYEVRVNVVGQAALGIKIDSQKSSRSQVDWRRYDVERTPYTPYTLPGEVERQCLTLTHKLGLEFGAIDLIRTPDGEYVFLEINGNGQFLWAQELSGVPISESLARLLAGDAPPLAALDVENRVEDREEVI